MDSCRSLLNNTKIRWSIPQKRKKPSYLSLLSTRMPFYAKVRIRGPGIGRLPTKRRQGAERAVVRPSTIRQCKRFE